MIFTQNPIGSSATEDLQDNAISFDYAMNSPAALWQDRFGKQHKTVQQALKDVGFKPAGFDFVSGGTLGIGDRDKCVFYPTDGYWYSWNGKLPYVVPANSSPTPGGKKGWGILDRSTKMSLLVVNTLYELLSLPIRAGIDKIMVTEYRSGTGLGGGFFIYKSTMPKSRHNGGTIFSSTVPWDGSLTGLDNFVNGVGEKDPAGFGCYVRECNDVRTEYFGCFKSVTENCSASWAAACTYAARTFSELVMIDGPIRINRTCVIDGATTGFRSIKLKGTFCATGVSLNYTPDTGGSVVITEGKPALLLKFNLFSNESYSIKGVGFIDSAYYPRNQPLAQYAPIKIEKGNPDGSSPRYITGHVLEDVAFSGYMAGIEIVGMGTTISSNFIGPTSCVRVSTYNQGDLFRCVDSTMNHLWISDSNLFGLDGFGVNLVKTVDGPGGLADVTYNNIMVEGARGLLNTFGHGIGARSRLVMNSVNRESCGFYGANVNGKYTGNPLGRVIDTDIVINGVWTEALAFNEESLPLAENGSRVSSSVPANFIFLSGSKNLTPELVNYYDTTFNLATGQTISKTIIGTGNDAIDATVRVVLNDGRRGVKHVNIYGYTTGTKLIDPAGLTDPLIEVVFSEGTAPCICTVTITNNSQFITSVTLEIINRTGMNAYAL